jgi:hypothetical protein
MIITPVLLEQLAESIKAGNADVDALKNLKLTW